MPQQTRTRDGIGAPLRRREDRRFLTGRGRYVDDLKIPGALHCAFVRSPHARAAILAIDLTEAAGMPGVVAVLTGADMAADDVGPMTCAWAITSNDGTPMAEPPRWALAREAVHHVGEPVAVVIAGSAAAAADAADHVAVAWEDRPAVVDADAALDPAAPQLHPAAPGNRCFHFRRGSPEAVDDALDRAAHLVSVDLVNHRLACAAIEPRATAATVDPVDGRATLYSSTQVPHLIRRMVCEQLGMPVSHLRVVAPDMGGGFGTKGKHYPEETVVVWAARRLGRAVRWTGARGEAFVSDTQARAHHTKATLALDDEGTYTGLRVETVANIGAYVSTYGAAIPGAIYSSLLAGVYRTPAIQVDVTGVFTNTVPTDAYRGAGRPEACYVLERLTDKAADLLGMDRAGLRARNLIPAAAMPYATPVGPTYDCGDFPSIMKAALAAAGYDRFEKRRAERSSESSLCGIGMAMFVESSGVAPSPLAGMMGARGGFFESADIRLDPAGGARIALGTHNHGQGHETAFAQIASEKLGIPADRITIVEGDTDHVPMGTGTFGSRSIAVGGSAVDRAAARIVDKGRIIAAHLLEAAAEDVTWRDGRFEVAGTDRRLSMADIAKAAYAPHNYPLDVVEPGLQETAFYDPPNFAFSNGCHVCAVAVDPETGAVDCTGYWVVDDIGTVINPVIVEGQVHGGLAQGIGQALMEHCVYEAGTGQLLAGSFMDYAVPRADDLPFFDTATDERQPCTHNPLGAKGCGESGTIGAPAAVVSAVLDALKPLGVTEIAMPLSPHNVWRTIRQHRYGA